MFRKLREMWAKWKRAPLEIAMKKEETKQKLDELHSRVQSDKISDTQLTAITVCLEAETIKMKPMKGGAK